LISGLEISFRLPVPEITNLIPGVSFSYFDIRSKSYKTLNTEDYVINVEKGAGNADQVIAKFTSQLHTFYCYFISLLRSHLRYIGILCCLFAINYKEKNKGKSDAFYDEVLKALWGYISDKLNIPVSRLSKDNIEEKLRNHGVSEVHWHSLLLVCDKL